MRNLVHFYNQKIEAFCKFFARYSESSNKDGETLSMIANDKGELVMKKTRLLASLTAAVLSMSAAMMPASAVVGYAETYAVLDAANRILQQAAVSYDTVEIPYWDGVSTCRRTGNYYPEGIVVKGESVKEFLETGMEGVPVEWSDGQWWGMRGNLQDTILLQPFTGFTAACGKATNIDPYDEQGGKISQ